MCGTEALVIKIFLGLQFSGSCANKFEIRNKNILDTCQNHYTCFPVCCKHATGNAFRHALFYGQTCPMLLNL